MFVLIICKVLSKNYGIAHLHTTILFGNDIIINETEKKIADISPQF